MPLKAVLAASTPAAIVIILGLLGTQSNTSIAKSSKYIIEQYKEVITQLIDNQAALKE